MNQEGFSSFGQDRKIIHAKGQAIEEYNDGLKTLKKNSEQENISAPVLKRRLYNLYLTM
jgi:hypothetical protein